MGIVSIVRVKPDVQTSFRRDDKLVKDWQAEGHTPIVIREEDGKFHYFQSLGDLEETYEEMIAEADTAGDILICHEHANPALPRRVYFDLDVPTVIDCELADGSAGTRQVAISEVYALIDVIIEATCRIYHSDYCPIEDIGAHDFLVYNSNGAKKFSYHVLAPIYGANLRAIKQFIDAVLFKIRTRGHVLEDFIDLNMTSNWGSLRMPHSSKRAAPSRVKLPDEHWLERFGLESPPWSDALIGWYYTDDPAHLIEELEYVPMRGVMSGAEAPPSRARTQLIVDMATAWWRLSHPSEPAFGEVWRVRNDSQHAVNFERLRASRCSFCGATHTHDNTLVATIGRSETAPVRVYCRRHAQAHPGIDTAVKIGNVGGGLVRDTINKRTVEYVARVDATKAGAHKMALVHELHRQGFKGLRQVTMDKQPKLAPFPLVRTLYVRAAMKMGKTAKLIEFLNAARERAVADGDFSSDGPLPTVYISFRQTFSSSIQQRLNEAGFAFESYNEIRSAQIDLETHPLLIVQVESLCRVNVKAGTPFVLVLDESESVLGQFTSPFVQQVSLVYSLFQRMLLMARHVVCMDANLGPRTIRLIEAARGINRPGLQQLGGLPPRMYYENYFGNAREDSFLIVPGMRELYTEMHTALKAGKKVFVCSNSLNEAKCLLMALRQDFGVHDITGPRTFGGDWDEVRNDKAPETTPLGGSEGGATPLLRLAFYSAETSVSIKQQHFSDLARWWTQLDVLIYTPTVTAGISFEEQHFDVGFGIFTSNSCDVETCRQMLGRVRSVRDHRYVINLQVVDGNYPTDRYLIESLLLSGMAMRELVGGAEVVASPIEASFNARSGEVEQYKAAHFDVVVENIIHANLSRNSFAERFIDQIIETGARVLTPEEDDTGTGAGAGTSLREYNKPALHESYKDLDARQLVAAPTLTTERYHEIMSMKSGRAVDGAAPPITAEEMVSTRKTTLMLLYAREKLDLDWVKYFAEARIMNQFRRIFEFATAVQWGVVRAKDTIAAVERGLPQTNAQGGPHGASRVLRRWFVVRLLHHLGVEHLGAAAGAGAAWAPILDALERDLEERLARGYGRSPGALSKRMKQSVWPTIALEFDMRLSTRAKNIATDALLQYFGISVRDVNGTITLLYNGPLMEQVTITAAAKPVGETGFDA